jgi:hypothetical protein
VYLQSGDPEAENVATLHAPGLLGARFTVVQPSRAAVGAEAGRSKTYQLIRTDSTMSVNPYRGATAWWADKTQYLVTTSPTALGRGRTAGVFQNAITPGNYGCVQTRGPAITKLTDGSAVTANSGQFVIPSATAGKATTEAVGTAASYPPLGVIAGALDAAAMEVVVDLDVPETT